MKESQLLCEKITSSVFVSTCSNLVLPSFIDLHTHATAGHVTSFACTNYAVETLPIDRWHDRTTRRSTRSIAIEVKHETLPANRYRVRLLDCTSRSTGMRHAVGEAIYLAIVLDGHHLVMTGHNARRPRTGRERGP